MNTPPPEAAQHSSPAIVTGCRQLSTIFVTVSLPIGSSWRLQTSHRLCNNLTPQEIFTSAPECFGVGTRIALQANQRDIQGIMHHWTSCTNAENKANVES
jgi:hypothetical protein